MDEKSLTQKERSHLNAILASIPVSRPYLIVSDTELQMTIVSSGDTIEELLPEFDCYRPKEGGKTLLINVRTMSAVKESGSQHVARSAEFRQGLEPRREPTPYFFKSF